MNDSELLEKVKSILLISTNYHDEMLKGYISEVKDYMKMAGVNTFTLKEQRTVGIIAKGVSDLWTQGELSNYFYERLSQLAIGGDSNV